MVFHSVLATRTALHISATTSKDISESGCTVSRYGTMPHMSFATVEGAGVSNADTGANAEISMVHEESSDSPA